MKAYGDKFKIVCVDIDRPEGVKLAHEYGLVGQPSYIFFDSAGEEVRRVSGAQSAEVMAQEIERILRE